MEVAKTKNAMRKKLKRFNMPLFGLATFLLGALIVISIRFVTLKNDSVHYHANFALYVNGQKDEFKSFTFYEEESACTQDDADNVKGRVHMHDEVSNLVHVHAHGVTWGQFFANLGYTLGDKALVTDNGTFVDGQDGNKLSFLLDGQAVTSVQDRVIKTEDVLLINYGKDDDSTLKSRYDAIPRTAHEANTDNDPSTCKGDTPLTFTKRLKESLGFSQPSH